MAKVMRHALTVKFPEASEKDILKVGLTGSLRAVWTINYINTLFAALSVTNGLYSYVCIVKEDVGVVLSVIPCVCLWVCL